MIKHRFHRKKVLLVLDDVHSLEQLQKIVGEPNWFGFGSKVIITTRDKHLLARHGVERKYEVEGLGEKEALRLLSWNAFKNENLDPSYEDILKRAVTYACGLPLALEVVGSNLFDKSIDEWISALDRYKRIPINDVQKVLKISFDTLEEYQQNFFLDIACCFKGYKWDVIKDILHACHDICPKYDISVLVEKSLIKIDRSGYVTLHDLIVDMGREIVRQESLEKPGKRSRLWLLEDIVQVLEDNTGTGEIEIITLEAPRNVAVQWDGEAFKKMTNLKILIIRGAHFSKGAKHLPNSLRVLEWWSCPSNYLPSNFHPKKLAILKLPSSNLKVVGFFKKQKFMNLRVLKLDESNIEQISDLSGAPNLVQLSFNRCRNLVKVHESIGFLDKLHSLTACHCTKLRSFPALMLPSLELFELSWCSGLESFPEILGEMEGMKKIDWYGTPIKELPSSITNLTKLRLLFIFESKLSGGPHHVATSPYLEFVYTKRSRYLRGFVKYGSENQGRAEIDIGLGNLNMTESVPIVLAMFHKVVLLDLSESNLTFLPVSIKEVCSLRTLALDHCKKLREIRGIPPNIKGLSAINCTSLTSSSRSMLLKEELHDGGDKTFHFPGSSIPKWFEHSSKQDLISFWFRNKLPSISLCVVVGPTADDDDIPIHVELSIKGKKLSSFMSRYLTIIPHQVTDHIVIIDEKWIERTRSKLDKVLLENEWNHVVCRLLSSYKEHWLAMKRPDFHFPPTWEQLWPPIKEIGIHVLKHKSNMQDIRFTDPFLQKEEVNMGDFQKNTQQQENLASLALLETPHGNRLSLRPPPTMNSLKYSSTSIQVTESVFVHEEQEGGGGGGEKREQFVRKRKGKAKQLEGGSKKKHDKSKQKEIVEEEEDEDGEEKEEKEEEEKSEEKVDEERKEDYHKEKEKEKKAIEEKERKVTKGKKNQSATVAEKKNEEEEKDNKTDKTMRPPPLKPSPKKGKSSSIYMSNQGTSKNKLKGRKTTPMPLLNTITSSPHQSQSAKSTSDNVPSDHPSQKGNPTSSCNVSDFEKNIPPQQSKSSGTRTNPISKVLANNTIGNVAPEDTTVEEEEQEEDLLADLGDLDKAISISLAIAPAASESKIQSTLAKEFLAASTTLSSSVDLSILISLLRQVQELLKHQLEVLAMEEGLQKKLFGLLQQLDAAEKPEVLASQIISLREFYESLCVKLPKAQSAISSHQKLVDAQGKNEKDLESYTKIQATLLSSVSKGKAHFEQLSTEIQDLECQLTEKRENKDNLGRAIKRNEINLGKAEEKLSKCLQDRENIEKALPASTKAAKNAERLQNELRKQLSALEKSFDNF